MADDRLRKALLNIVSNVGDLHNMGGNLPPGSQPYKQAPPGWSPASEAEIQRIEQAASTRAEAQRSDVAKGPVGPPKQPGTQQERTRGPKPPTKIKEGPLTPLQRRMLRARARRKANARRAGGGGVRYQPPPKGP